jgi:predicted DNA-binding protein (MmcQ/YjbR family)
MPRPNPLLAFCASLPHVTRETKWGNDRCFCIGGKMFAAFDTNHGDFATFKTTPETFAMLTGQPGIRAAPHSARLHWVAVRERTTLPRQALQALIEESYQLAAAKLPGKVRKQLGFE